MLGARFFERLRPGTDKQTEPDDGDIYTSSVIPVSHQPTIANLDVSSLPFTAADSGRVLGVRLSGLLTVLEFRVDKILESDYADLELVRQSLLEGRVITSNRQWSPAGNYRLGYNSGLTIIPEESEMMVVLDRFNDQTVPA